MVLIRNARIVTPEGIKSWMQLQGNSILKIGDGKAPNDGIDLGGKIILPGLMDNHIHVYSLGRASYRLQLEKPASIAEMRNRLEEYASNHQGDWIIGHNWDQDYMEDRRYPNKWDIDDIVSDRPAILFRGCNHIGLVNSLALQQLGIDDSTPDPVGGEIDRDDQGHATGILRENALQLVTPHIRITDHETRKQIFKLGLQACLQVGLTAVATNDPDAWSIYRELAEADELPIRVYLTPYFREMEAGKAPQAGSSIGLLKVDRLKVISDGSLGAQTAALREPYTDTGKQGLAIFSQVQMTEMVRSMHTHGYRLEIHAIGDLSAEQIINAVEGVGIPPEERPIITHCQILGKDLIKRMCNLGIIANIQPPFVTTDSKWVEKRLGNGERLKYSYAWKTLLQAGVHCAGGSDAPIESPDPLHGMHTAIFRYNPSNETWKPEEQLTFEEALDLYSIGVAYALKEETRMGQIKIGNVADFIVLGSDVLNDNELLEGCKVEQVWVDGIRRL